MAEMANSLDQASRRDDALKMREEVLALYRKVSDPEHPDTIKAMQVLADSYCSAGSNMEAIALLENACVLCRGSRYYVFSELRFGRHAYENRIYPGSRKLGLFLSIIAWIHEFRAVILNFKHLECKRPLRIPFADR